MIQRFSFSLLAALLIFSARPAFSQSNPANLTNSANIVFGLSQPLLGGFNIEGNVLYKRLVVDYSHGVSLNLDNEFLRDGAQEQGLAVHIPFTTGFGVGYRFNDWLNLRVEPKWHRFELYYDGEAQTAANRIADYTGFSLGLGLYGNFRPFKHQDNFLKGIMVAPSVRWWPEVSTTLDNNQLTYQNEQTGRTEVHESLAIGVANTPWLVNVSVGYGVTF